jgi:hypothetical protein
MYGGAHGPVTLSAQHRTFWRALLHIALPIGLGAAIYLLWRSPQLLVFRWVEWVGLSGAVDTARVLAHAPGAHLPQAVLFSLPDGLWVYGLTAAMTLVWNAESSLVARRCWVGVALVLALTTEAGQAVRLVPGTFDFADVVFCVAAAVLATRVVPSSLRRR